MLKILYLALLYGLPAVLLILALAFGISVKRLKTESDGERKTKKTLSTIFGLLTVLLIATAMTNQALYFIILLIGIPAVVIVWFFISLGMYFDVPQGVDRSSEKRMLKISAAAAVLVIVLVIAAITAAVFMIKSYTAEQLDTASQYGTQAQ